ncbi:hypothetical protein LXA47_28495 [Massilia sp. P8910]|uniref:hypothetical protein n=1 Tax=Massilia antarctica TaxID=2765360 RepID=UPI001E5BB90C|nr:hypothetical protein [Massilia antarctica]MCE3607513.1 hypothetical protein [Massilia antarctica]
MNHTSPIYSQVPVLVTIVGVDAWAEVYYTYDDPTTGEHYNKWHKCSFNAVSPFQTLFALDYATSRNGWVVISPAVPAPTTSTKVQPLIPSFPDVDAARLVLITQDWNNLEYKFDVVFYNQLTRTTIWDDPQEGNILQPTKPGGAETDHAPQPRPETTSPNM